MNGTSVSCDVTSQVGGDLPLARALRSAASVVAENDGTSFRLIKNRTRERDNSPFPSRDKRFQVYLNLKREPGPVLQRESPAIVPICSRTAEGESVLTGSAVAIFRKKKKML